MLKYPVAMRAIVCLLCFISLIWGCDKKPEAPPEPKVVTKKIVAQKDVVAPQEPQKSATPKPEIKEQVPAAKTEVAAKPMPKPEGEPTTKQIPKPEAATAVKQEPEPKAEPLPDTEKAKTGEPDPKLVASLASAVLPKATDVYDPQGKLDPFVPLFQEEQAQAAAAAAKKIEKSARPLTPLEKVDLSQLQLVAVIRALSGDRAMVQDASGKGFMVKKGTYIGTRSGKITAILEDRIIVEEEVEDLYGKVSVQKRPLIIQKPPGD